MSLSIKSKLAACLAKAAAAVALALMLPSCGGGGGGGDDVSQQPAPQTLNAIRLTLYPGFNIVFVRDSGNVLNGGVEAGTIFVTEDPVASAGDGTDARDILTLEPVVVQPPSRVFLATYTYERTGPDSGLIVINGQSIDEGETAASYMMPDTFDRTYQIVFATDYSVITDLVISDWGEALPAPGLDWTGAELSLYGGGSVPVGYSLKLSEGQPLPYLFPNRSLKGLTFDIIPDSGTEYFAHRLDPSALTVFDGADLSYDRGTGLADDLLNGPSSSDTINYEYRPDQTTIDTATIEIVNTSGGAANFPLLTNTYTLTFGDFTSGTYVDINGATGKFRFPDIIITP